MSKHWKPEAAARPVRPPWPEGATVGLVLIAAACIGLGVIAYQVAGPRDSFAEDSPAAE